MKLNGRKMLIVVNGDVVGGTKSFTLNINVDLPPTSSKDSAGWAEREIYGEKDWDVSFDGLYDSSLTYNFEELFDALTDEDEIMLEMAVIDGTGGGLALRGRAKPSSISLVADNNQPVTFSGSFAGNGSLVKGTVASS